MVSPLFVRAISDPMSPNHPRFDCLSCLTRASAQMATLTDRGHFGSSVVSPAAAGTSAALDIVAPR